MKKRIVCMLLLSGLVLGGVINGSPESDAVADDTNPAAPSPAHVTATAFLEKHCVDCHGQEKPKGKFQLHDLVGKDFDPADSKRWQNIVEMVDLGDMPPPKRKQPVDD